MVIMTELGKNAVYEQHTLRGGFKQHTSRAGPAVWGGFKFCGYGAGANKKFQPTQDSIQKG